MGLEAYDTTTDPAAPGFEKCFVSISYCPQPRCCVSSTPLSTLDLGLLLTTGGQRALSPWWRPSVNDASSIRRRVFIIGRLCHDSGGLVALPCVGFRGLGTPQWSRERSREWSRERPRLDSGCGRVCPGLELFGGLDGLVFYLCFLPRWEGARSHQIPTVG